MALTVMDFISPAVEERDMGISSDPSHLIMTNCPGLASALSGNVKVMVS